MTLSLNVHAQQADTPDETNLDTQLYLIVGTNQDVDDAKMPASLDTGCQTVARIVAIQELPARRDVDQPREERRPPRIELDRRDHWHRHWPPHPNVTPSFSRFSVRQVKLVRNS